MQSSNTYYVCLGNEPQEWDIFHSEEKFNLHTDYFRNTFLAMELLLHTKGWTIYLTWNTQHLPSYGPKVVAVVLGDELSQVPLYSEKVGIIF